MEFPLNENDGWPTWVSGAGLGLCGTFGASVFKYVVPTVCSQKNSTYGLLGWPCIGSVAVATVFIIFGCGFLAVFLHHILQR